MDVVILLKAHHAIRATRSRELTFLRTIWKVPAHTAAQATYEKDFESFEPETRYPDNRSVNYFPLPADCDHDEIRNLRHDTVETKYTGTSA